MDELRAAIDAADWPRALVLAIEAWREMRVPALADLVDRIAARCPTETAPRERVHPWWTKRARTYDPIVATALLASASDHVHKSDEDWGVAQVRYRGSPVFERLLDAQRAAAPLRSLYGHPHRNLIARLALLAAWPDDPRVARVLATWFAEAKVFWQHPLEAVAIALYEVLAGELARLRDTRVIAILERVIAEPQGKTVGIRDRQRELASRVIDQLAGIALNAPIIDDDVARWCPAPVVDAPVDESALWADAARDRGACLVLADYLLERGDRRGEIITLACSGNDDNVRKSFAMLHEHWDRWMGDLALVLDRGNCKFVNGLMEIAAVGLWSTPEWAYSKVARHRELASVRVVRPGWNASESGYVLFLDALAVLPPRVRLTATMVLPFHNRRRRWPVRELELVFNLPDMRVAAGTVVELAAQAMPDVETIELPMPGEISATVIRAVRDLPASFPKLARVRIDAARVLGVELRAQLAELAALPFVTVDHGAYEP